jgi:hypothetical protein
MQGVRPSSCREEKEEMAGVENPHLQSLEETEQRHR